MMSAYVEKNRRSFIAYDPLSNAPLTRRSRVVFVVEQDGVAIGMPNNTSSVELNRKQVLELCAWLRGPSKFVETDPSHFKISKPKPAKRGQKGRK